MNMFGRKVKGDDGGNLAPFDADVDEKPAIGSVINGRAQSFADTPSEQSEGSAAAGDAMIRSYEELLPIGRAKNAEIDRILTKHPTFNGFVSATHDLYVTKPKNGTDKQVLSALYRICSSLKSRGQPNIVYVEVGIYESYARERNKKSIVVGGERRNQFVESTFSQAIDIGATDVHMIIKNDKCQIDFRINQEMVPHATIKKDVGLEMIRSMFEVYSVADDQEQGSSTTRQDYNESKMQDTAFKLNIGSNEYMCRVNSDTEVRGNTAIIRIRDTKKVFPLELQGYTSRQISEIRHLVDKHSGMLLFTGPTNSGKSTILTTIMASLPRTRSIWEIADPVEVILPHVNHKEVKNDSPAEMAEVMKALMRKDPDYFILGEIRSRETAEAAIMLATAGVSLMSTMHTNSVVGLFSRALRLGIDVMELAGEDVFNGAVSQNLIGVLCNSCKTETLTKPGVPKSDCLAQQHQYNELFQSEELRYKNDEGCSACNYTGLGGMTLIAEVLTMNTDLRDMVANKQFTAVRRYMMENGIATKYQHGALKILDGELDPRSVEDRLQQFTAQNIDLDRLLRAKNNV